MIQSYQYFGERERERERTNTKLSLIWREKIQHYRYLGEKRIQSFRPDVATNIQNIQQLQKTEYQRVFKNKNNIQQFRNGHEYKELRHSDNNGWLSKINCYSNVNL
jgi:hypothetical protein